MEDAAYAKAERSAGGGKGGRGGGGAGGARGGGRGGGKQGREVLVSKALSRLLRHQADNAGIKLDGEGYAPLDRVLAWGPLKSLGVTLEDVKSSVTSNEKQRFSLKLNPATTGAAAADDGPASSSTSTSPADYLIRANQGHSIKLASASHLEALTPAAGNVPPRVLHGTYVAFWPAIEAAGGLSPMGRNHVHCAAGTPDEGVVSGMRKDAEILVEIDVEASVREKGIAWWRSDNGVVLTEGDTADDGLVSTRFFKLVEGRKGSEIGVLWRDGVKVADVPEGIKAVIPPGKESSQGRRKGRGGGRGGDKKRGS